MNLTIYTEGMDSFSFDLNQDDVIYMLDYAKKHSVYDKKTDEGNEEQKPGIDGADLNLVEFPKDNERRLYKGFLMIKCDCCGEVKGFCAKKPIDKYFCNTCKESTPLVDLKPMYMDCDCGKHYKYKTNLSDESVEYECINCGKPRTMVLNRRKTAYVTEKDNFFMPRVRTNAFSFGHKCSQMKAEVS